MNTTILRGCRASSFCQHTFTGTNRILTSASHLYTNVPRHASTISSPSSNSLSKKASSVNGPPTTLPAPLSLPTRGADQAAVSYYFALGKTFLAFYKTGIKNVYYNFNAARALQTRINEKHKSLAAAVKAGGITRSEFQLLARNWHDAKRVPLFGLVILICGEFTPLVVLAISNVVPRTCRIPRQIESDRRKLEARRLEAFRGIAAEVATGAQGEELSRNQLRQINASLGLSSKLWEWVGGLPSGILAARIKKRLEYLDMDDTLLRRAGGVKDMDPEEVKMALVERGVDVLEKEGYKSTRELASWLSAREKKVPIEKLLLTRPSVWSTKPGASPTEGQS